MSTQRRLPHPTPIGDEVLQNREIFQSFICPFVPPPLDWPEAQPDKPQAHPARLLAPRQFKLSMVVYYDDPLCILLKKTKSAPPTYHQPVAVGMWYSHLPLPYFHHPLTTAAIAPLYHHPLTTNHLPPPTYHCPHTTAHLPPPT